MRKYWKQGKKAVNILKRKGFVGLFFVLYYRLITISRFRRQFRNWLLLEKRELQEEQKKRWGYEPLISIIVPVYNVKEKQLEACINSVLNQTNKNWELCIADDASTMKEVKKTLKKYENNPKIKIIYRKENGHISKASNSAIELATGEYIAFLDCDDILAKNAIYEMTKKLNDGKKYDFIYSDEDKIDEEGKYRHTPHFKSDWSKDTLLSHMYTCHFSIYRKSIAEQIGFLRSGFEGAQDYDFTLRFTEKTENIGHIPKILYHWRERKESTSGDPEAKPYVFEATKRVKEDAMKRQGIQASFEKLEDLYQYRIVYKTVGNPLISILIISKDNTDTLAKCLKSLKIKTKYRNFEIIVFDSSKKESNRKRNNKLCKAYHCKYYYNLEKNKARQYNNIANKAKGDYLLFLSDMTEIKDGVFLERMLGQAMQKYTGVVGAKLVIKEKAERIVSDGIITLGKKPCHIFRGMSDHAAYYFNRNRMDYNYMAVSGKCMMLKKELFFFLGGFDERFQKRYYDIELCYRAIENGCFNIIRNDAVLYCCVEKEQNNTQEKERERKLLYQLHPIQKEDGCYNRNLVQKRLDCGIREN